MSLGLSMSCSQSQTKELRQELTQKQCQALTQAHILSIRLSLIQALTEDSYEPRGNCPACRHRMTAVEILKGFNRDVNDFTTGCPKCRHRFAPRLIHFRNGISVELPFYCEAQTLDQLKVFHNLEPDEIARRNTAIYRSAIFYHGNLKAAFAKIGVAYKLEKAVDWENKIGLFLGRLPDSLIARYAGISAKKVHNIRKKLKIPKYSAKQAEEEAVEDYDG